MLTAAELTAMRTTAGSALPDSCVIQSRSLVSDGGGGGTVTWTASGTVDCRLAPAQATEDEHGGRISPEAEFTITLPSSAAVTTESRIVHNAGIFNVEAVRTRSWNLTQRVEANKES